MYDGFKPDREKRVVNPAGKERKAAITGGHKRRSCVTKRSWRMKMLIGLKKRSSQKIVKQHPLELSGRKKLIRC